MSQFWNAVMTDGKLMPPFHQWRDSKIAEGKKTICLRHAVFNPPGSGSPITKDKSFDSKCTDNSIVQAFGVYTLQKMGVVVQERPASKPLAVTFISRKDYAFNTNMNMQRKIDNEPDVCFVPHHPAPLGIHNTVAIWRAGRVSNAGQAGRFGGGFSR